VAGVPSLRMNDGREIPQLGFGVFQIPPEETVEPVRLALEAGYRLIDTAQGYGNEEGVGKAIADSDVARSEIFVTTKLTNSEHGRDKALAAFDDSLNKLGLDFVDLFLIHWPQPMFDDYVETWKALEEIRASGRARSIGVSNFTEHHLNRLFNETDVIPAVNQVELHPEFQQAALRAFHADHQILTEAWSPEIWPISGSVSSKEKTSMLSRMRWGVTDFGMTTLPSWTTPRWCHWRRPRGCPRRRSCSAGTSSSATWSSRSR
jgi:2,5-diketo-D-gluconate reductase A